MALRIRPLASGQGVRRSAASTATESHGMPLQPHAKPLMERKRRHNLPEATTKLLDNISVVLCSPQHFLPYLCVARQGPQNVGASARALQNFGMSDLRLTKPMRDQVVDREGKLSSECREHATSAGWVLDSAEENICTSSVTEAIGDSTYVLATSSRWRGEAFGFESVREASPKLLEEAARGRVAILFGNERTGLTNDDMQLAHSVVTIPAAGIGSDLTGGTYTGGGPGSINLSHAVAITCYEIFTHAVDSDYVSRSKPKRKGGHLLDTRAREELKADLLNAVKSVHVVPGKSWAKSRASEGDNGHLEAHERKWEDSINRFISAGPVERRDANVMFRLARRVGTLGELAAREAWMQEPMMLNAAKNFLLREAKQGRLASQPSQEGIRVALREGLGLSLEKRELATVLTHLRAALRDDEPLP